MMMKKKRIIEEDKFGVELHGEILEFQCNIPTNNIQQILSRSTTMSLIEISTTLPPCTKN